jgi:signal transduction histidine kinase
MNSNEDIGSIDSPDTPRSAEVLAATLAHRERQIEAIRRTSEALFSHPSVDAMVEATLKIALDVLRADAGTVYLHDASDDTLVFRYVIGGGGAQLVGKRIPITQGVAGTVFRNGKPMRTDNVQARTDHNEDIAKQTGYQTQSMMTVPVKRSGGEPIGVMQILNAHVPFTDRDLEVLEVLCAQAATGIEHAQLAEEAKKAQIVNVLGDISHDIKNMLTPILSGGWTLESMLHRLFEDIDQLKARCGDQGELTEELGRIADSVRHDYGWILTSTINAAEQVQGRTKEIADAIKGELSPPFFEVADLNETCRNVVRPLRTVAERGNIQLLLELDETMPQPEYDRHQMYNALYNLVNNAIPETPAGGSVTLRTRGPRDGENRITIEVQDTGRGMPVHVRERLFTDQAISTKPGGTGLGTRIVAGVVKRHNGTITVDSAEGEGTVFTVRIPVNHA